MIVESVANAFACRLRSLLLRKPDWEFAPFVMTRVQALFGHVLALFNG